ncbi:hypothetical protein F5X96DRAFT_448991 [Biscogniauxia mediterranea]|nr:hypothetical protein F5X96DRAFT_448991 [Biscogniauxia mediterranea]
MLSAFSNSFPPIFRWFTQSFCFAKPPYSLTMAHRSRTSRVSDEDLIRNHDEIVNLYIDEGVTLEKIREKMKRTHGFDVPTWQYEAYFRARNIRKNVRAEEWDKTFPIIDSLPPGCRHRVVYNSRILKGGTIQRARKAYNKRKRQKTQSLTDNHLTGRVSLEETASLFVEVQQSGGTWSRCPNPERLPSLSFVPQQESQITRPLQTGVLDGHYNDIFEGQGGELDHDFNSPPERAGSHLLFTNPMSSSPAASIDDPWQSYLQPHGSPVLGLGLFSNNDPIHEWPPGIFNLGPQIRGESPPPRLLLNLEPAFAWLKQLRFGMFDGFGHIPDSVNRNGGLLFPSSHNVDQGFLVGAESSDVMMKLQSKLQLLNSMLPGTIPQIHGNGERDMLSADDIPDTKLYHIIFFSLANGLAGLDDIPIGSLVTVLSRSGNMASLISQFLRSSPRGYAAKAFAETLFRAAIEAKEANIVKHVLATGLVDVNHTVCFHYKIKRTPIERAVTLCSPSLVKALMDAGANPHVTHNQGGLRAERYCIDCMWLLKESLQLEALKFSQPPPITLEWVAVLRLLYQADDARTHSIMGLHRLRNFAPSCKWTSEIIYAFLSVCKTNSGYPFEFIETGILYSVAMTLEDTQATEVCRQILQTCDWRLGQGDLENIKQALVGGSLQGHSRFVALLLPYCEPSWIPLVFKASIRSGNNDLIRTLLEKFLRLYPFLNRLDTPEEYKISKYLIIEFTTSLAEAIGARNAQLVRRLEEEGALQFTQHADQRIPFQEALRAAAGVGDVEYMRKLLLRTGFKYADFALEHAINNDLDEFAIELLKAGAYIYKEALCDVLDRKVNFALVRMILEVNDPSLDSSQSAHILRLAIHRGETSIVEYMLKVYQGDITDYINHERKYSEIKASTISNFIYQLERPSRNDLTWCLESSIREDDYYMVQQWLEKGADACDRTIALATPEHPKALRILLDHIGLYRRDVLRNFGTTALFKAIQAGTDNTECFDILLSSGLVDFQGVVNYTIISRPLGDSLSYPTPFDAAIYVDAQDKSCSFIFTKKILKAGGNLNALMTHTASCKTQTPFLKAICTKSLELVTFLLEEGADPNTAANFGIRRTPLQLAAEIGNLEIIDILLQNGADVNGKPAVRHGGTALQLAAIGGNCKIAATLLAKGADLYAEPSKAGGRWPIEGAAEHGRLTMIEYLWKAKENTSTPDNLRYDFKPGFEDKNCREAMQLAGEQGHFACVELLSELSGLPIDDSYFPAPASRI